MSKKIESLRGKPVTVHAFGKKFETIIDLDHYRSGGKYAIELVMANDSGNPFCTLTCNIPSVVLTENEILVKTWSENEEVAKAALASGLFRDTGKRVSTGFVLADIWEVL